VQEPNDMFLTGDETKRAVVEYMFARSRQTGETPEAMAERYGSRGERGGLLGLLARMRVTREKYANMHEFTPSHAKVDDNSRLAAIPDAVRQVIASNAVVEGETVHQMREWQELSGDRSRGLLLLGKSGHGKSLHASMLLLGSTLTVEPEGHILSESTLAMYLGMRIAKERRQNIAPLLSAPLVVIDYMGQRKAHISGWEASVIEFMRLRWEAGKRCVLTFRGDLEGFRSVYGADGWATVERFCTVLTVRRGA